MKTWLVSRHPGTLAWFAEKGIHIDNVIEHLDNQQLRAGDRVIGTLPIHLIADLNTQGVEYVHLALTVPRELRGKELSANDMESCNPRLEIFSAQHLGSFLFN